MVNAADAGLASDLLTKKQVREKIVGLRHLNIIRKSWCSATLGVVAVMLMATSVSHAANYTDRLSVAEKARAFAVCERATARWERISDVPNNLLRAISLAESGLWSKRTKRLRAWPWTVTSGGPGSYFATRADALREVRRLQAKGVTNIDVGCMQVNLHYHGHHFDSAESAIDPDINVAYAAQFLGQLRDNADNWAEAAGYYHSMTPERTKYYRGKVEKFWAELGQPSEIQTASAPAFVPRDIPTTYTIVPIDRERTAELNKRFKTLKKAARKLRTDLDPDLRRKNQLEAWRNARGRAEQLQHLLALRKAELEAKRQRDLRNAFKSDKKQRFAENRKRQLQKWRAKAATETAFTN